MTTCSEKPQRVLFVRLQCLTSILTSAQLLPWSCGYRISINLLRYKEMHSPHVKRTDIWICVQSSATNSRFPPRCRMPTYRKKQKEVHTTVGGKGTVGIPWALLPGWHPAIRACLRFTLILTGGLSPPGGGVFSSSKWSDLANRGIFKLFQV